MVRRADKPSLRFDSCCNVEVVNGGDGERTCERCSTETTLKSRPLSLASRVRACGSESNKTFAPADTLPVVSSKSLPVARRTPPSETNCDSNDVLLFSKRALTSQ